MGCPWEAKAALNLMLRQDTGSSSGYSGLGVHDWYCSTVWLARMVVLGNWNRASPTSIAFLKLLGLPQDLAQVT